jgi:hypothetical protein
MYHLTNFEPSHISHLDGLEHCFLGLNTAKAETHIYILLKNKITLTIKFLKY